MQKYVIFCIYGKKFVLLHRIRYEHRGTVVPLFINKIGNMIEKDLIVNLLSEYIAENNLELVEVKVNKANNIKVFFTAPDRKVEINDCSKLSRFIESKLDREKEDFSLMVSSAEKPINQE